MTGDLFGEMYLRKSRALGDPDDPALLAHHRAALLRLAAADGVTIPPESIIEEIGSGERIDDRPAFRRRLEQWQQLPAGTGGLIYVTEVSRLTRGSSAEWGRIEEALRRAAIKIRTRSRLFDLANPEDCNWLEIEALFGRMELRYMKMRAAAKRVEMVRDGLIRTGGAPWGYRWDKLSKQLEPAAERFPILVLICRQILTTSIHRLSRQYGIPAATLSWTLSNPAICGWPAQRYSSGIDGRQGSAARLPRDQWLWPEKPGSYLPACTRAEWEVIQQVIADRKTRRAKTGTASGWCRDVVRFIGNEGVVRLGSCRPRGYPGYLTYEQIRLGQPRLYVDRAVVHAAATAALASLFARPAIVSLAIEAYDERAGRNPQETAFRDAESIRRQLARERDRLAGLKTEQWDPDLGAEERRANRTAQERVTQSVHHLKAELQAAEQQAARVPALDLVRADLPILAAGWTDVWAECDDDLRQAIVNACLAAVDVVVETRPGMKKRQDRRVAGFTYSAWLHPFLWG